MVNCKMNMKFGKKLAALLLSASMLFALAACGGTGGKSPSSSGAPPEGRHCHQPEYRG